jgi:hypothetical protein
VTPFSVVKVGHRLGGTCCRHLEGYLTLRSLRNVGKHVRLHGISRQKTVFLDVSRYTDGNLYETELCSDHGIQLEECFAVYFPEICM